MSLTNTCSHSRPGPMTQTHDAVHPWPRTRPFPSVSRMGAVSSNESARRLRRRWSVAAVALVASSCAADPVPQVATTVTAESSETASPTTAAPIDDDGPAGTAAGDSTDTSDDAGSVPTYRLPDGLPEGSGCTPNLADGLPQGVWFGYLRSADLATITFDLACFYEGDQATAAATTDGVEVVGRTYVRNVDSATLELPVNAGISIQALEPDGDRVDTGDWYAQWVLVTPIPDGGLPVWIVQQPERISALVDLAR